ncbi:hypothetical protein [Halorussus marinus]|uniref:hypothetical protein n=1 Tax=Halorussus marinus TaxID=2505976 RepID=UPI00106EEFE5|nr:hypothetical protein [Halorussus marinus]
MVEERTTDGKRIAQLLASEVDGREDSGLSALDVADADPDAEGSADGELAYRIVSHAGDETVAFAAVYAHEDRTRVEFQAGVDAAAEAAADAGLRVRPKAVRPPRTVVFVEDGAAVKRATDAVVAALQALEETG